MKSRKYIVVIGIALIIVLGGFAFLKKINPQRNNVRSDVEVSDSIVSENKTEKEPVSKAVVSDPVETEDTHNTDSESKTAAEYFTTSIDEQSKEDPTEGNVLSSTALCDTAWSG